MVARRQKHSVLLFHDRLESLFEEDHVEDCVKHASQEVILDALDSEHSSSVLDWILEFTANPVDPTFAASVLLCISRLDGIGTSKWRSGVVAKALRSHSLEVRDAGIKAAESWEDPHLLPILENHNEPVEWLRDYLHEVKGDLES